MVEKFEIRLAQIEDMKDVFDLANDDLVRQNSFIQARISWEGHQNWYKNKINDENCSFYLMKDLTSNLIAQIRFDKSNNDEGEISISVSPEFRGKGYGVEILKACSDKIISEQKVKKIIAYVKPANIASRKIFEKSGYLINEENIEKVRYEFNAE